MVMQWRKNEECLHTCKMLGNEEHAYTAMTNKSVEDGHQLCFGNKVICEPPRQLRSCIPFRQEFIITHGEKYLPQFLHGGKVKL
jgi:hypothetical protein